jgi:uncharacterized membrane protein
MNGLTVVGWGDVFALMICATSCLSAAISAGRQSSRTFWVAATALVTLLIVYRFFNLEHVLTNAGRRVSREYRIYDLRRFPQAALVSIFLITVSTAMLINIRSQLGQHQRLATAILLIIVFLYSVRLLSLHQTDEILYASISGLRINWLLEIVLLTGLTVVATMAATQKTRRSACHRRS